MDQEIINLARNARDNGAKFKEIARLLNKQKMTTTRGKKWTVANVGKLLRADKQPKRLQPETHDKDDCRSGFLRYVIRLAKAGFDEEQIEAILEINQE